MLKTKTLALAAALLVSATGALLAGDRPDGRPGPLPVQFFGDDRGGFELRFDNRREERRRAREEQERQARERAAQERRAAERRRAQAQRQAEIERRRNALGGTKMCSVVLAGEWRDTIPVPQGWTVQDCYNFARALTAQYYQLACVFDGGPGFSFGSNGRAAANLAVQRGGVPEPNCGWEDPRRTARGR